MMGGGGFFDTLAATFPQATSTPLLETPGGRTYTYADVLAGAARYARALAGAGVRRGDRVLTQVEKSPEGVSIYLACLRAGFVFLPLNTAYREAELAYFVADAEPAAVVCDPRAQPTFARMAETGTALFTLDAAGAGSLAEAAAAQPARFESAALTEDDVAAILYTSGTTGRPKGAMLTHRNLRSNAEALVQVWGFGPGDVLLHALPMFHAHGLFTALHCVLLAGARMLFLPRFEAAEVARLLPRASVMMGVPTFYARLLREPGFGRRACRNVRLFVSGSAPLPAEVFERFRERTGHALLERYGTTEAMIITSQPLGGERRPGAVGRPLPDIDVRLADEHGRPVATGATGRLQCRGPNVFKGYWRAPEKTAETFTTDGYFVTGDLARRDPDGYIVLVGRESELIISGGYNVYPREVEAALEGLEGVAEAAVFGAPHPDFGEGVVAAVVPEPGAGLEEAGVIADAKGRLAGYKTPKRVVFVAELPRNRMGKIQKNRLQSAYRDVFRTPA